MANESYTVDVVAMALESGMSGDNSTMTSRLRIFDDIVWTVDFAMLLLALVVGIVWLTYVTYYNARVIGFILTKVANFLHKDGLVSIGSLSVSLLSGKLMLADFMYFHRDFTIRIQYACIIFRYWRPYKPRSLGIEDFSHSDPRILIEVSGLEIHAYNRVSRYWELDKLFGLGVFDFQTGLGDTKDASKRKLIQKQCDFSGLLEPSQPTPITAEEVRKRRERAACWMNLIPRVDISILAARFSCGNRLLPSTLVVSFENSKARYSVKSPSNSLDEYLHVISGSCENIKVSLVKSPDYTGHYEQPPRTMGEGFVVLQTSELEFYYYQEEPGVTPVGGHADQYFDQQAVPCWGSDLKLGKGTVLSYGPWADEQRDRIYRFFFPPDFQVVPSFRQSPPGIQRQFPKFDLRLSTLHDSTIDIWFLPDDVPQTIHITFHQGSYCDISMPMVFEETGYVCTLSSQLMMIESSTSLPYRSLLSSETLEFKATFQYPRRWNDHIQWEFLIRGCKSTLWMVYEHKNFLQKLFNEWISIDPPDICKFIPYTYIFDLIFDDMEAVVTLNEHNWIDTSSNHEENRRGAISGRSLHLSFALPFIDYMPDWTELKFTFAAENLNLLLFFPEQHILSQPLRALHSSGKQRWRREDIKPVPNRWRGAATSEDGWLDICYATRGTVTLVYYLHPVPARPLWLALGDPLSHETSSSSTPINLDPDKIQVELDIGPCFIQMSSALVMFILALKENYFGEAQDFMEVEKFGNELVERKCGLVKMDDDTFDMRKYRPLHVSVSLTLHEIEVQCLNFDVGPNTHCPLARTEKLVFEMDKQFTETKMQLCVTPAVVRFIDVDVKEIEGKPAADQAGQLLLTGFQLRGHALFSAEGLALDSITLEYGWLIEILVGDIFGRLTLPHMVQIVRFLETFLQILTNKEEDLPIPKYADVCQHMWPRSLCPTSIKGATLCDTEHALKYRMTRISVDGVNLCLLECNSALELNLTPIRVCHCTEHTAAGKLGANLYIPYAFIRQFVRKELKEDTAQAGLGTEAAKAFAARIGYGMAAETDRWLECGKVSVKSISLMLNAPQADSSYYEKRREFQLMHDQRSRRLAFLHRSPRHNYSCGCVGGCVFFGDNWNGCHFTESVFKQQPFGIQRLTIPKLEADRSNPGYGQSILRPQELITTGMDNLLPQQSPMVEEAADVVARSASSDSSRFLKSPDLFHEALDNIEVSAEEAALPEDSKDTLDEASSSSATSRSSSYVSAVSRNDENTVNLYYQISRPIVCSSLLLSAYGRYLDTYVYRKYRPTLSNFTAFKSAKDCSEVSSADDQPLINFCLKRHGLNDVSFMTISEDKADGGKEDDDAKLFKDNSVRERREQRVAASQSDSKESTISDLHKIEIHLAIGDQCQVFVSPLGVEMIEQHLTKWIKECSVRHPASLLLEAFDHCSSRQHQQAIVASEESDSESAPVPIRLTVDIPRIDLSVFQCGIVEKIVPFAHLAHATSLMPASIFVTCVERLSAHAVVNNAASIDGKSTGTIYAVNAGFERLFFHLTQIIEKGAPIIGISKNASKIGRWVGYDSLHLSSHNAPCVVMEGKVVFVDLFLRKVQHENDIRSENSTAVVSPVENKEEESVSPEQPPMIDDDSEQSLKNQFNGLAANISVHFGLLQPLESSGDNWPLYDLFAPSTSAWLHVVHRVAISVSAAVEANRYARNGPFCFLLTEALNCDRVFSVRKSKFEKLKLNRKKLHECPSCQTLLALMRYCVAEEFVGYEQRFSLPEELKESRILRSAAIALLSHWREALCANKFVQLNPNTAKTFVKSPTIEERNLQSEMSILIDMDGEAPRKWPTVLETVDSANTPSNLQLQLPKSRIESLQNLAAKFDHFAELDAKNAADNAPRNYGQPRTEKSSYSKRHQQLVTAGSVKASAKGAGAGEDLYEWMKREQESDTRNKKRKQSRYRRVSGVGSDEVNPMDVPLYVYFDYIFEHLKLKRPKKKSPIFDLLGHDFVADFHLHRIVSTVNEPKYLGLAGSTLKRVTHTERPLIGVQQLSLRADAKYSEEPAKEATMTPLPGAKEDASPPKQAVQSIDYHANVVACDVTVGFPSVTFINQVVYVVRSTKETFDELQGRRKVYEDQHPNRQEQNDGPKMRSSIFAAVAGQSTSSDATEQAKGVGPPSRSIQDASNATIPTATAELVTAEGPSATMDVLIQPQDDRKRNVDGSSIKSRRTGQMEKGRQDSTQYQRGQSHWTKRMLTMLRDFQRAKRSSIRRQSPTTPSPGGDAILVTTVLGAIDCSKIEINAIFTELFAYATFKSVQFGHKSTESWAALGPSQLRSSDKSVRGALKQINLTLSEAQSTHSTPISVLTFSVAESHAIFRRYLLHKLSHHRDDSWRNSLGVEIGPIHVDIPLHPGSLHGLVMRGTRNISDRLPFLMTPSVVEEVVHIKKESIVGQYSRKFDKFEKVAVVHFKAAIKEFQVDAALLPSVKATYKMMEASAFGETGSEAKFQVKVPNHEVAFDVKGILTESQSLVVAPKILVAFPTIDAKGAYLHHSQLNEEFDRGLQSDILFKEGGYLQIDVEVGGVQHTLTTDLLNQLLFIQEAFTREIGDIIQKIKSEKKPTTFWSIQTPSVAKKQQLLYSIEVSVNTIQIMATTPTASAVRLDTENVRFHISNRLMQKTKGDALERVFGVTELNISLALGQLVRVASHQEAEPEFQQVGYFRTGVIMRNVASSSDGPAAADRKSLSFKAGTIGPSESAEAAGNTYLLTLYSPIIFAQPTAVDKALLLWLNYKNAYEFWNEQRSQIRPKAPRPMFDVKRDNSSGSVFEQLGSPPLLATGSLFLQVSVENGLYICVPLYGVRQNSALRSIDTTNSALVVSLRNTGIAVCSHGALVCRGRFNEFGLRFVEDFDGNADNWNPSTLETIESAAASDVNACFVPEGTYDICSKTINPSDNTSTASWILNISWQMKGFDMNLNTRIWKLTSLLVSTLTSLAATENEDEVTAASSGRASMSPEERPSSTTGDYAAAQVDTPSTGADEVSFVVNMERGRNRKKALQKLYHDLVTKIRDLEQQEADELLVERERKKLLRLEALLFSDSRRDVMTKLRRQAQKATTSLIDQWGLNVKPSSATEEDADRLRQQQKRQHHLSDVSSEAQSSRRFSEFPARELLKRKPRAGSIDTGSQVLGALRQISESGTPSPPECSLSFDLGEDLDILSELRHCKSPSPGSIENGGKPSTDIPKIVFEGRSSTEGVTVSGPPPATRTQPPAIDLYLDLSIYVENGRCNFRTVPSKNFEQHQEIQAMVSTAVAMKKHDKEARRRKQKQNSGRTERIRVPSSQQATSIHTTTIYLPGLSVKASYASSSGGSKGGYGAEADVAIRASVTEEEGVSYNVLGGKHGQLIMWMSLEKMPEETVISPHILDFLEQMLEPVPASTVSTMEPRSITQRLSPGAEVLSKSIEEIGSAVRESADATAEPLGLDASTLATVASFPLDIVFHLNVQSSQIRFTSQPLAQIECILRLPALQLVGTSRKYSELVVPATAAADTGLAIRRTLSNPAMIVATRQTDDDLSGGICVTVLLTGFSVSVFHMYSAGARAGAISTIALEKRDALSIHMDTVGISLSRSRIAIDSSEQSFSIAVSTTKLRQPIIADHVPSAPAASVRTNKNSVKVSLTVNMGKAQFKYDMRRLHEILQFPKAWYRRAIFRRLFLGDETTTNSRILVSPSIDLSDVESNSPETIGGKETEQRLNEARSRFVDARRARSSVSSSISSDEEGNKDDDQSENDDDAVLAGFASFRKRASNSPVGSSTRPSWDALVLFGVNFEELSIEAMMGQVMGETRWVFAGADCQGHFALSSDRNKSTHLTFRLAKSELVARQGQVSGLLHLSGFEAAAFIKKSGRNTPQSAICGSLECLDIRIDWMSSPTFVGRLTQLTCSLKDDWRTDESKDEEQGKPGMVEQVSVLLVGKISWDSFRLLITQTTITDIIRICYKVNEFIDQSLQSGRMALFSHAPVPTSESDRFRIQNAAAGDGAKNPDQGAEPTDKNRPTVVKRYHRHWQKALALVTSLQLQATEFFPIPKNATVLGGALEFSGSDLALGCFGSNFHSKEWLVFHLREPSIEFSTEAKDIGLDNGDLAQLINQDMCFRLGQRQMRRINTHMGTVLCVTGAYAVTHSSSIDEWLTHAFTSVLNRVYKIPTQLPYRHQYKEAFYIPPFAMHVKTKQIQPAVQTATTTASPPIVESSVIADFEDHLKINVQEVLYLRRFIKAYISRQSEVSASAAGPSGDRNRQVADPTQELQKDAREYKTTNWHVEPTIRLMSLESMETTDYLWQILGIYQYAVTVSKWLQRGFLDPLDSAVASAMEQILLAEKKSKQH